MMKDREELEKGYPSQEEVKGITEEEYSFDELARGLGSGTLSRRNALRMALAAILGGTLGSFLAPPKKAEARRRRLPAWQALNPAGGSAPAYFDVFGPSSAVGGATADRAECATVEEPWTNYGPDHTSAAFYKDGGSVVHLKGLVKGGATGNPGGWGGCPIFFLPEGYRPAKFSNFSVVTSDSANPGRLEIRPNGGVYCLLGGNGYISLDGITSRTGQ